MLLNLPPQLVGCRLKAHIYDDRVVRHLGTSEGITLSRLRVADHNDRPRQINYRHVIASLVRNPQAFRRYLLRAATCRKHFAILDKPQLLKCTLDIHIGG